MIEFHGFFDEIFLPVKDISGYYISNYGSVFSQKCNRFIVPYKNRSGYLGIVLMKNLEKKRLFISRIVAAHFCENSRNVRCVDHLDNNPLNNYYKNLEWVTDGENTLRSYRRDGRKPSMHERLKGEQLPFSKLTEAKIRDIKQLLKEGYSQSKVGSMYGVGQYTISRVNSGKRWGHLKQ